MDFIKCSRMAAVVCTILLSVQPVDAAPVDVSAARQKAQSFLATHGSHRLPSLPMRLSRQARSNGETSDYYIFNVGGDNGFVIVSGDDRAVDILGYADHGTLDAENLPDALSYLLDGYAEQMAWIVAQDDTTPYAARKAASTTRTSISPIIKTRWNQGSPYNNNCPTMKDANNVDQHTVTGCVATSMAQLMYFHQWPTAATAAISGYKTRSDNLVVAALPPVTFSWSDMLHSYSADASGTPADAVAQLMQYCGAALRMDYGLSSSSSYNPCIAETLKEYFGYDASACFVQRRHYDYQDWVTLLYSELAEGRPIVLGGQSTGGGHSFVCDGYDAGDYFHINWGWGGTSDGYFRLSALNPYEQGLGGSSSYDGFSYSQEAVIGIRPGTTQAKSCLTLETIRFGEKSDATVQTLTRTTVADAFTGLSLYLHLCSYRAGTNNYDFTVQLCDASGNVVHTLLTETDNEMLFNKDFVVSVNNLSTPENLPDGTYTIHVMGRLSTDSEWQECYDGDCQQVVAVVDGTTMTLTAPVVEYGRLRFNSLDVTGNLTKGHEQKVTVSITGGNADYHRNLFIYVSGKRVVGKQVDVPAGETVSVVFYYIPTTAGTINLDIYDASGKIGTGSVTIAESDATDQLALSFNTTVHNISGDGTLLYGNALRATVIATNPSTANSYAGRVNCSVRKWTVTDNGDNTQTWEWTSMGVTRFPLVVEKNGTETLNISIDDLEPDTYYSFRLTYLNTANSGNVGEVAYIGQADANSITTLRTTGGCHLGTADGTTTVVAPDGTVNTGDACYVDLTSMADPSTLNITPSTNPNCVYFLPSGATAPATLSGCNVVIGGTAASLTLSDGSDFYTPSAFHVAGSVSYSRLFTIPAAGSSGWNTIIVPFDVTTVTCGGKQVYWFLSASDSGKNFWLKTFTGDDTSAAYFDFVSENRMKANTPYIIAVPDNRWGDDWDMTKAPVVFSASDVDLAANAQGALSGNNYAFEGSTTHTSLTNVYALNDRGSRFVKATTSTADAFRAWLRPSGVSALTQPSLTIASGQMNGILLVDADRQSDTWYSLDGRLLHGQPTTPGIYINNGKKVIVR